MAVERGHQRAARLQPPRAEGAAGGHRPPALGREAAVHAALEHRGVDRQRAAVLDEDARLAAGAGAGPDRVATQEVLADARAVGQEVLDAGAGDRRIGDPLVEVRHQRGLVDRRQILPGRHQRAGMAAVMAPVELAARMGMLEQVALAPAHQIGGGGRCPVRHAQPAGRGPGLHPVHPGFVMHECCHVLVSFSPEGVCGQRAKSGQMPPAAGPCVRLSRTSWTARRTSA